MKQFVHMRYSDDEKRHFHALVSDLGAFLSMSDQSVFYRLGTTCHQLGGKDSVQRSGRSAGAGLHEVPGLTPIEAAADSVGARRSRARRRAPGAPGGNRDGTAAGVGWGVSSQLRLVE